MTTAELTTTPPTPTTRALFRHILVATDFSRASRRALCDAVELAAENDAQLSVVHVLQPDIKYGALENPPELDLERIAAEQQLRSLDGDLGPVKKINTILVKHRPVAEAIASVIAEQGVDLLVIGTRGRGSLPMLALGSVAEELLRLAPCPVMTIGPKADIAVIKRGVGFRNILFATDFGNGSAKALPLALALAKRQHAKLVLLHMVPPMPATTGSLSAYAPVGAAADELADWEGAARRRSLQRLKECLPADAGLEQEPEYIVGTNFLPEGILTAADKFKIDLIVMGANRTVSARIAARIPWTAVHEVVRSAPCPVLTVAG
jgi:nucleotide-binding universal stress UspA family protein